MQSTEAIFPDLQSCVLCEDVRCEFIKSNQNFLALQSQLEEPRTGSPSPAATMSPRCRTSTLRCRTFPTVIWAQRVFRSTQPLVPFTANAEAQKAPKVKF